MHLSKIIANGSALAVDTIGENNKALKCVTAKSDCCNLNSSYRFGEWYYPGGNRRVGVMGMMNEAFYRTRGNRQVLLHRRNNMIAETGMYCCEVADSDNNCGINQMVCVNLGKQTVITITTLC